MRIGIFNYFNKNVRDLKRDIASKLETLEKQTQKAIVELIRKKRVSDRERERERERGIEDRLKVHVHTLQ